MKHTVIAAFGLAMCGLATPAFAQKGVPVATEPHHHLVYTGDNIRVFRVEVPAHGSTLIHEHVPDYFWISVGPSEFVNASVGKPEVLVNAADGSVHFTRGGFSHLARVDGPVPFRNVTVEMPETQTNPRNLCDAVLPDQPTDCDAATKRAAAQFIGAGVHPAFETDQERVTLLTLAPNAQIELARRKHSPILIAVDDVSGGVRTTCPVVDQPKGFTMQSRSGNTYRVAGSSRCTIRNPNRVPVRFLAVEFTPAPKTN
jgi:hypothetical protein